MYVYMESDPPFLYWAWREAVREAVREERFLNLKNSAETEIASS